MKIFYDENSIDCVAATYLLRKYFSAENQINFDSITALQLDAAIESIDTLEIVIIVGWHKLSVERFSFLLSASSHMYWFAADENSVEFLNENTDKLPSTPYILVEGGENIGTSTLVYINFFTKLITPTSTPAKWKRKINDHIPQWISYLNMKDSIRADRFRYAIEKEMDGLFDEKWNLFDKEGISATAEIIKWIDRGQLLMERDQKEAEQQRLLQQQGEKKVYKAPESWTN